MEVQDSYILMVSDRTSDFLQSEAGEITIAPRNEGDIKIDLHVKLKDKTSI